MVREWVQAKPTYHVKTDQAIDLTQQQQPQTQPQPKPQPHTGVAQARNHQPHDSQYQQQAPQPARSNNFFYPGFPSGSYQYVRRMLYYMVSLHFYITEYHVVHRTERITILPLCY